MNLNEDTSDDDTVLASESFFIAVEFIAVPVNHLHFHRVCFVVHCVFGTPGVVFAPVEPDLYQLVPSVLQYSTRYI